MTLTPHTRVSSRVSAVLRGCAICCLLTGTLLLSTFTFVWADAHCYQTFESWRFTRNSRESRIVSEAPALGSAEERASLNTSGALVGRLEIARLGISVMVLEGADDSTLRVAAGHVPNTSLPGHGGNVGIAGHRDTFFRPLQNIRASDEIVLETPGETFRYVVEGTWVVAPEQIEVLDPTARPSLTLVTCYPFHFVGAAPYRFIVRAHQIWPSPALIQKPIRAEIAG